MTFKGNIIAFSRLSGFAAFDMDLSFLVLQIYVYLDLLQIISMTFFIVFRLFIFGEAIFNFFS